MEKYIYLSFAEADRDNALVIAEQMKADGYAVWYDDKSIESESKEEFLRDKEADAAFGLIYLTKRFLSDGEKMDGLYNLSDNEKPMAFILKEKVKTSKRFDNEFGEVENLFISQYDSLSELLQVLYQNEIVGSCRKKTDEFEQCIYYRDPEGKAFVQYRSLTKIPDKIFDRKCKMVVNLEAKNKELIEECEALKKALEAYKLQAESVENVRKENQRLTEENKQLKIDLQKSEEEVRVLKQRAGQNDAAKAVKEPVIKTKKNISVGSTVKFGSYPQGEKGEIKPIDWEVLDVADGKALLLSKDCLDVQKYHSDFTDITWADCSLRNWLNNEFLTKAFTKTEQAAIKQERIENPDNPEYGTIGGENTEDRIFCLSISEAERYLSSDEKRQKKASAYAMTKNPLANKDCGHTVIWWLRSPGFYSVRASDVWPSGKVFADGLGVALRYVCVCPALYVDIANL